MTHYPETNTFREQMEAAVREMDPKLEGTDPNFTIACVILASAIIGADESALARGLGYDPEFVGIIGSRLRTAGVWREGKVAEGHRSAWESEDGGIAFWMDVAVAAGEVEIVGEGPGNDHQYSMTPAGRAKVERLLRQAPER